MLQPQKLRFVKKRIHLFHLIERFPIQIQKPYHIRAMSLQDQHIKTKCSRATLQDSQKAMVRYGGKTTRRYIAFLHSSTNNKV
jgi:hypothetical protein